MTATPSTLLGMHTPSTQAGFTLVEILMVIAVLGLLAAILLPNVLGARVSSQRAVAQTYLQNCVAAAEQQRNFLTNSFPTLSNCKVLGLPLPKGVISANFTYPMGPNADATLTVTFKGKVSNEDLSTTLPYKPATP